MSDVAGGPGFFDDDPHVPQPLGALKDEHSPPPVRSLAPHRPRWGAGDESVCGDCCAASGCKRPVEDVEVPSGLL